MKKSIFILFIFLYTITGYAQDITISSRTELINGKKFYLHEVLQGQTLYSIAKAYSVGLSDIYEHNPGSKDGIRAGEVLKIPAAGSEIRTIQHIVQHKETLFKIASNYKLSVDEIKAVNPGLTDAIKPGQIILIPVKGVQELPVQTEVAGVKHIVQKGETLYSIARQYSVTPDQIRQANKGIPDILQTGQEIVIPIADGNLQAPQTKSYECGTTGMLPSYNIALMLPFYLEYSYEVDTATGKSTGSTYRSLTFIQFYEGLMLAVDSLERAGIKARIYVYDIAEDTSRTHAILEKPEMKNMHLIIGPLFSYNFRIVSEWAKTNKIPLVNPYTNRREFVEENPFVFKLNPGQEAQIGFITDFILANYTGSNVILAYQQRDRFSKLAGAFAKNTDSLLQTHAIKPFSFHNVNYTNEGLSGISKNLKTDTVNIIIAMADGEAFINNLARNLDDLSTRFPILVIGQRSWEGYTSLEVDYMLSMNLHVCNNVFIDYSRNDVSSFVSRFRAEYKAEPDTFAFDGYDIGLYFIHALHSYGTGFYNCLDNYNPTLLTRKFSFSALPGKGYENTAMRMLRYQNYFLYDAIAEPRKEIPLTEKKRR